MKKMELTLFEIIKQVVTSWQVIVTVIVIILYINLVSYVARRRRGSGKIHKLSFKSKKPKPEKSAEVVIDSSPGQSVNDELGLEEE